MRVTQEWYVRYLERLNARKANRLIGSGGGAQGTCPVLEQVVLHDPLETKQAKEGHPNGSLPRFVIEITSYRCQLTDPDNLCPKFLIDAIRHSGWIPNDTPDLIELVTRQVRVSKRDEQRTVLRIYDRHMSE